ncbi:hypothetical protein F5X99DRAFT_215343 [Biscogniauxia marginata]|nr:hypothetical protein F5X99DRAFT_215343 [Biscogniauxia marginata]
MKATIFILQIMAGMAAAGTIQRSIGSDSDEAVVYPAGVDQSWVDARDGVDSDEAVVYPAGIDQSWIDADGS